ncbi:unnamed protein product [Symbiodinium sp. CCMP2592]|nr:unnamed protein product [Symbiodinium sp. CCMP2592]
MQTMQHCVFDPTYRCSCGDVTCLEAFPALAAIEEFPALDVEPPQSEMLPHTSAHDRQVLVLHGRQELVLLSPAAASILELPSEGFGFKLQVSSLPASARPLRAVLRKGDFIYVPAGWWIWSQALGAVMTLRRSFQIEREGGRPLGVHASQAPLLCARPRSRGKLHSCSVTSRRSQWAPCRHRFRPVD